jgi:HPt (histidine-containing phosphotransfer) domain-containing protein
MPATSVNPQHLLASVWQRNLPLLRKRIQFLNTAALAAHDGHLSLEARREASEVAHKLAGSLGMFGYDRGTQVARELEVLLDAHGTLPSARFQELAQQLSQAVQI